VNRPIAGLAIALALVPAATALADGSPDGTNSFSQTNLIADDASFNPQIIQPNMRDAWGIALRPPGAGGHIWIDNAFSGTSDTYIGDVAGMPLHQDGLTSVTVHQPQFTDHGFAFVTGLVYNAAKDLAGQAVEFPVPDQNLSRPGQVIEPGDQTATGQPAQDDDNSPPTALPNTTGASAFAFVTEDGCINCWRSNTATAMTDVPIVIDYSKTAPSLPSYFPTDISGAQHNAVFSGCAISVNSSSSQTYINAGGNHLYAADFDNNLIEVFDNQWNDVTVSAQFQNKFQPPASVTSATFPGPNGVGNYYFHVFNIMDLNGHLYVTWAVWNAAGDEGQEETDGAGYGHVAEYNEDGSFVRDFNDQGMLNAPWGLAIAPAGFGKFGGDLLVANFGDGTIAAFDPNTGNFVDQMRDASGNPISIDGIWGLVFGNGVSLGDANSLYFTAGPNSEFDGLFGKLTFNGLPQDTPTLPLAALGLMGLALLAAGVALGPPLRLPNA
jgi:uncharacterized protein (TIGR03118 family)